MTRLLCLALLAMMASSADAIESGKTWISVADGTISMNPTGTDNSSALVVLDNQPTIKGPILGSYTASTLPTGVAGQIAWCSNCYETDPCVGDANGTGAFARRDASAWKCSTPTKLHVATFCTSQAGAGNTCSSSSTWDKANIKFTAKNVTIRCMGGGGGGGAGGVAATSTGGTGGGGGAGGTYCENTFDYDAMPSTLTVMVGSKGNGATTAGLVGLSAANTTGNQGGPGTASYVYDTSQGNCTTSGTCLAYCYANGGLGGSGGIGSTITGTSGSPGAATTSARPWGNYSGGIGQGTGTAAANVPCKNAGPFLPDSNGLNGSSCNTGGSAVLPYGMATYAAGSGGGGGFAGGSSTTGTTGGTGGRSAHTLGAAGGAASTAALGAQGGTAGSSFGNYYGVNLFPGRAGGGGGGGGGRNSGAPGNGGAGGYPGGGGGGGGGGAIGTGNQPGAGGNGADGYCQIITTG